MEKIIMETLNQIEYDYGIKILYACETGSRAWGYAYENSDFDVRFIYLHPPEWYLSIDPQKDIIELPVSKGLDINGWDLPKCLKLFRKSNPSILEWIHSSIIYSQAYPIAKKLRELTPEFLSPTSCIYHYVHMAQKNVHNKSSNAVKKYLTIIRPLLAAGWIERYRQFPPVDLLNLIERMVPDDGTKEEVKDLFWTRKNGESKEMNLPKTDAFIYHEIDRLGDGIQNRDGKSGNPTPVLNRIFYKSLKEVWGI